MNILDYYFANMRYHFINNFFISTKSIDKMSEKKKTKMLEITAFIIS